MLNIIVCSSPYLFISHSVSRRRRLTTMECDDDDDEDNNPVVSAAQGHPHGDLQFFHFSTIRRSIYKFQLNTSQA